MNENTQLAAYLEALEQEVEVLRDQVVRYEKQAAERDEELRNLLTQKLAGVAELSGDALSSLLAGTGREQLTFLASLFPKHSGLSPDIGGADPSRPSGRNTTNIADLEAHASAVLRGLA